MLKRKILIIKTGFSEFLDRGISITVSLGDVLMCTVVLHAFKDCRVTWVTSQAAKPLLLGNPYIHELMIFGPTTLKKIAAQPYDVLVNLEKDIGFCAYASQIKAKRRYGFYFDEAVHDISTHNRATRYLLLGQENHKNLRKNSLELIYEAVGKKWNGEGFILGYRPAAKAVYDVGFNFSVGSKWPTKAWPMEKWKALEQILTPKYSVSWQQGQEDMYKYIDWVSSCRLIVTSDSLGQLVGQILGKQVITLFGSTHHRRMEGIPGIHIIKSTLDCPHRPCYQGICKFDKFCMDYIAPEKVAVKCEELLGKKPEPAYV